MDPIFELHIDLPPRGSRTIRHSLLSQLRQAILDGRLKAGAALPATRTLARRLAISRNTVIATYDRLAGEGYLIVLAGSGARVAPLPVSSSVPLAAPSGSSPDPRLPSRWHEAEITIPFFLQLRYDFRVGAPDISRFPFFVWQRLQTRAVRALSREAPGYGAPQGHLALRDAIAGYVSVTRAVACVADDVIVTSGAQQAFDLIARVFVNPQERTRVAVENPGYPPLRATFAAQGAEIVPVPVDAQGICIDDCPQDVSIVAVTPSHQFPLGIAMSPTRRETLLAFAAACGAILIEDDYDGEFRFGGHSLEALRTLDRSGSVFYVGTFSKSMLPALRMGYIVAPRWARDALVAARHLCDGFPAHVTQVALAAFIAEGHLTRHVRAMRRVYSDRKSALVRACDRWGRGRIEVIPALAGLHVALTTSSDADPDLPTRLREAGVGAEPLQRYAVANTRWTGMALGLGAILGRDIDPAIAALANAL